jgi:uncharacterized membrane protein YvbJ
MKKCYKCGAAIAADATFCPQCFTRFDSPEFEPTGTQPTAAPRIAPGYAEHDIDRPGKYPEIPHYKMSRFRSSQTSMGLIGRLFFTIVFLAVPIYIGIRYLGWWNLAYMPAFLFGLAPIFFKAIWKKVRVPVR